MKKGLWKISLIVWLISLGTAVADDTAIFGSPPKSVEPNVMIIFDTSGSMGSKDIPKYPYDKDTDYTANSKYKYTKDAVYRWSNDESGWVVMTSGVNNFGGGCSEAVEQLSNNGQTFVGIDLSSPFACSQDKNEYDLRIGNFLNYETGGYTGDKVTRLSVAKEVTEKLFQDHPDVRFGLMRFDKDSFWHYVPGTGRYTKYGSYKPGSGWDWNTEGGHLSAYGDINWEPPEGVSKIDKLIEDVKGFKAQSMTPLAETLAEAGLYFAGETSWFNNTTYTSPIDIKCRPNYIILMTDGDSTADYYPKLSKDGAYINGGTISDYDNDSNEDSLLNNLRGSDYLDDVAAFLFNEDLMPNMGEAGGDYEKQNIITHTIGFKNAHRLLRDTASAGGGLFFTANSADSLAVAFDQIMGKIEKSSQVFVTPSVPVSKLNGVYAGDYLYIGLFQPDTVTGLWRGNLKKYKLDDDTGFLLDKNNNAATDSDGKFLKSSVSFWSSEADGTDVMKGGAGSLLASNTSRNLYTYIKGDGAEESLKATRNAFTKTNDVLTPEMFGYSAGEEDAKNAVIDDIRGVDKEWSMGDVLHSEPTVIAYDTNGSSKIENSDDAVIYLGTNGGMLHAFLDSTGQELWGFIPPSYLDRLKQLSDTNISHDYFLDGPPTIIDEGLNKRTLVVGERRGGTNYYVLDISDHENPKWKYEVGEEILGAGLEKLGQSWGRPQYATIATGSGTTKEVLLLPGGYDNENQDKESPVANDTKGRAVFSVIAETGALGSFKFYNGSGGGNTDMTHSIVDMVGVDPNGDGVVSSIYAPDVGGKMFAFSDSEQNGNWSKWQLFNASDDGVQRKILYSPDVIRIFGDPKPADETAEKKVGEMIFFGTGDRTDPAETGVENRFFAVKNYWWDSSFATLTTADLHDATANDILQGDATAKAKASKELQERLGWWIELENPGEKIVSSPVVYGKAVYFTTYAPPASSGGDVDDCENSDFGIGTARLYGLNYEDATAVHDDWSDKIDIDPETGDEIKSGGKSDRVKLLGHYMPSAPVIAISDGVAKLYVGVDGSIPVIEPVQTIEMNMYYWRELMK